MKVQEDRPSLCCEQHAVRNGRKGNPNKVAWSYSYKACTPAVPVMSGIRYTIPCHCCSLCLTCLFSMSIWYTSLFILQNQDGDRLLWNSSLTPVLLFPHSSHSRQFICFEDHQILDGELAGTCGHLCVLRS